MIWRKRVDRLRPSHFRVARNEKSRLSARRAPLRLAGIIAFAVVLPYSAAITNGFAAVASPTGMSIRVDFSKSYATTGAGYVVQEPQVGRITLEVWDRRDKSVWRGWVDQSALLEVRRPDGSRIRVSEVRLVSGGKYQTDFDFDSQGRWLLVALPDISDRSTLQPGSADTVEVVVEGTSASESGGMTVALSVFLVLILMVGSLVGVATRRPRHQSRRTATRVSPHDG